jgi:hypothetical protein
MFASIKNKLSHIARKVSYPLGFFDRFIEEKMGNYFHRKKDGIVNNFLMIFTNDHLSEDTEVIAGKLKAEADRVCNFTDSAILRANIKKAKYTFWFTAIGSTILVMLVSGFKTPLSFMTPPLASTFTYMAAIISITALYNGRVKGAMISTIKTYEAELEKTKNQPAPNRQMNYDLEPSEQKATAGLQHDPSVTNIVIDFIPSTIQIKTSLNNKMTISFTNNRRVDEECELLMASSRTSFGLQCQGWKNNRDDSIAKESPDNDNIYVPANGPVWHF